MMTLAEIRLKQNPILSSLLLGMGQGSYVAERLMPRLPQSLSSVTLAQMHAAGLGQQQVRAFPHCPQARATAQRVGRVNPFRPQPVADRGPEPVGRVPHLGPVVHRQAGDHPGPCSTLCRAMALSLSVTPRRFATL